VVFCCKAMMSHQAQASGSSPGPGALEPGPLCHPQESRTPC
jgi:hypothetical protein